MTIFDSVEGGLWGCVVVFSAFCIQVFAFGTAQSIGVYNIEFLRYFDTGAAEVSLVGSINLGVFLGAGPLSSILMARWSHRQVALLGAVLTNIGLICMPFAPNIPYMYAFYGVIVGLGNSLVYVPSHILSGLYFNKHRSLATGIATAGSGLGTTVFPIVMYHLIQYYGWQGSFFFVTGLNLHLFVFVALLRPVPKSLSRSLALEEAKRKNENGNGDITTRKNSLKMVTEFDEVLFERNEHPEIIEDTVKEFNEVLIMKNEDPKITEDTVKEFNELLIMKNEDSEIIEDTVKEFNEVLIMKNEDPNIIEDTVKEFNELLIMKNEDSEIIEDKSCLEIEDEVTCAMLPAANNHSVTYPSDSNALSIKIKTEKLSICSNLKLHFMPILTLDFILYWLSNICWNAGGGILIIFLPEYMTSVGLDKESASQAFTLLGAGECLGCVLGGLLGNIQYFDKVLVYISGNVIAGLIILLLPWTFFHTFIGQLTLTFLFGVAMGIILGLLVVVTSDLLGTEAMGHGFGYLMLSNGIGVFAGPPAAGVLIDSMGVLAPAMYFSGLVTIMGGIVMCIVPIRRKFCNGERISLGQEIVVNVN